jgi:hypothetical protein
MILCTTKCTQTWLKLINRMLGGKRIIRDGMEWLKVSIYCWEADLLFCHTAFHCFGSLIRCAINIMLLGLAYWQWHTVLFLTLGSSTVLNKAGKTEEGEECWLRVSLLFNKTTSFRFFFRTRRLSLASTLGWEPSWSPSTFKESGSCNSCVEPHWSIQGSSLQQPTVWKGNMPMPANFYCYLPHFVFSLAPHHTTKTHIRNSKVDCILSHSTAFSSSTSPFE